MRKGLILLLNILVIACQSENSKNNNELSKSDSLKQITKIIQDSVYTEYYENGQIKCATDMIIEKLMIKDRICFSENKYYETIEVIGNDTVAIEHPIHESHEVFDDKFRSMFFVKYDSSMNVTNKAGSSIIYSEVLNKEITANDKIDARFFIPDLLWTIKEIKIYLYDQNSEIDKAIIKKDDKYGLYFYNYSIKEAGNYTLKAISLLRDLRDKSIKVTDTVQIDIEVKPYPVASS